MTHPTETDRELLELAAKAAGLRIQYWADTTYPIVLDENQKRYGWNPLRYDSDALRLAVKLGLVVDCSRPSAGQPFKQHAIWLDETCDNGTLIRRAIVRAAAEIGRAMR